MPPLTPPPLPRSPEFENQVRSVVYIWATCCCSPLLYLGTAWFIKGITGGKGFYPLPHEIWIRNLIGLAVFAVADQCLHFTVKMQYRSRLAAARQNLPVYIRTLTRRTFTLILLSELPIFGSFCLFLLQGDITPLLGFGLFSMLLYAQSHPRSANPAYP